MAAKASGAGPLFIALAALLWATDALFRVPTVNRIDPAVIVFCEHLICVAVLLPWVILRTGRDLFRLSAFEWAAVAWVGMGGSAIATIFFTASFQYLNPSVVILLQKLQPVLVVLLAALFLGERPRGSFFGWALLALVSALVLSFPDLQFVEAVQGLDLKSRGVLYTLGAAGIWAISTVAGKYLLGRLAPSVVTFWRFAFGLLALSGILALSDASLDWRTLASPEVSRPLLYMGLVPGLLAVAIYYAGLVRTTASVTTFVELLFPVSAVALNAAFLDAHLSLVQLVTAGVLLFSVTMISFQQQRKG